jgi:murein DD-endopeptidase MepM/ murein hydrolase activator NlpD
MAAPVVAAGGSAAASASGGAGGGALSAGSLARAGATLPAPDQDHNSLLGWLAGLLAIGLVLIVMVPVLLITAILPATGSGVEQIGSGSPIPAGLIPVFNQAGQVFDVNPYLLASVADQESTFGSGTSWMQVNSAGCVGFMQTCVGGAGGDSWDSTVNLTAHPRLTLAQRFAYRLGQRPVSYPLETSTHPDYNDPFDAVMAGAVELRGKVGGRPIPNLDQTAFQAACGYYGACADGVANYAQTVLARARLWESQSALSPTPTTAPPGLAGGQLRDPLAHMVPTSPFCEDRGSQQPCHPGIDLAASVGTPIYAAAAGRVSIQWSVAESGGYGNYTCLDHGGGLSTCYAHQSRFLVGPGEFVTAGQEIGLAGATGNVTGPHLHFEVRVKGAVTCPAAYLGIGVGPLNGGAAVCAAGWQSRVQSDPVFPQA